MKNFEKCLQEDNNDGKWNDLLTKRDFETPDGVISKYCEIYIMLAGEKTTQKIQIANRALVQYMKRTKREKTKKSDTYIWYQPTTQNQHLRCFFGAMHGLFGWSMTIDDFNFTGGVQAVLKALYNQRYKLYGKVSFIFMFQLKNTNISSTYFFLFF